MSLLEPLVSEQDGQTVVRLEGEVDVYTSPRLDDCLQSLIEAGQRSVVIDLTDVTFIDSSGLAVLIKAHTRMGEEGGGLAIASPSETAFRLFELTGLTAVFTIVDAPEA